MIINLASYVFLYVVLYVSDVLTIKMFNCKKTDRDYGYQSQCRKKGKENEAEAIDSKEFKWCGRLDPELVPFPQETEEEQFGTY